VSDTAKRVQRIRAIFDAVIDLPPDQRSAALDRLTEGDAALRRDVEAVILRSERTAPALESPAVAIAGESAASARSLVGERIGPYTVVRLVGMGGMGAVYEATRTDDQYRKRVAIKIVQRDLDSELTLARFRRERQILASLEHPNIAALYDGGVMADGRPFLVMEYIEGAPITMWCNARSLPLRDRVALFRQVCAAVHHAHKNLVIHRDLKPGNILVADDGTVKLLDFGIAKLLGGDASDGAESSMPLTRGGARAFTPEYASPEQIRGEPLTTASDLYSLGVVLFELLTGRRPHQPKSRAIVDIERAVLDTPAPRPSSVITDDTGDSFGGQSPARIRQRLHGELDSITLTALHAEPGRRYASAEAFGDDLHNYLDDLPVRAQRDWVGYRLAKFAQRNTAATVASALVVIALVGGTIATAVQARRARAEQANALVEQAKAQEVSGFLQGLLASVRPESGRRDALVSQVLDSAARRVEHDLIAQPDVRAEIETVIGQSYRGLGRYDDAERHLKTGLMLRQQSTGLQSRSTAIGLSSLGQLYLDQGALDSAKQVFEQAIALQRDRGQVDDSLYASMLSDLGSVAHNQGRDADAEHFHRQALEIQSRVIGPRSDLTAMSLNDVGVAAGVQGRLAEAESLHREALAIVRANNPAANDRVAGVLADLAGVLDLEGKAAAADSAYVETLALRKEVLGPDHPDYALTLFNYSGFVFDQKRYREAAEFAREILALRGKTLPESHPAVAAALQTLGKSLDKLGDPAGAERALTESLALRKKYLAADSWLIASAEGTLAEHYASVKQYPRAEEMMLNAQRLYVKSLGETNSRTAVNTRRLVALYTAWGKPEKAAEYAAKLK
jgi:serine/threonine protein kinase/Tfp pilus assembly protein PilF